MRVWGGGPLCRSAARSHGSPLSYLSVRRRHLPHVPVPHHRRQPPADPGADGGECTLPACTPAVREAPAGGRCGQVRPGGVADHPSGPCHLPFSFWKALRCSGQSTRRQAQPPPLACSVSWVCQSLSLLACVLGFLCDDLMDNMPGAPDTSPALGPHSLSFSSLFPSFRLRKLEIAGYSLVMSAWPAVSAGRATAIQAPGGQVGPIRVSPFAQGMRHCPTAGRSL